MDAEGNSEYTTHQVTVIEEEGLPVAWINSPSSHLVDVTNIVSSDIVISGVNSLDLDNLLLGDALAPGLGITNYQWDYVSVPFGCIPPTLPANLPSFDLYDVGDVVAPECLGTYEIQLTVTDDDATPKTATTSTNVTIYNCAAPLCINYPTALNPQFVEFTASTDILIYYHLSSIIYDDPVFSAGLIAQLEIYHESDLANPVFTSLDPNTLGSDKGSILSFHWDGFYNNGNRPETGLYYITISLLDYQLLGTAFSATEPRAIWIEVVEPKVLPTTTKYIDFDELSIGAQQINIDYEFTGAPPDAMVWRIYDESNTVIQEQTILSPTSGNFVWDGVDATSSVISPGRYDVELEAKRGTEILGTSSLHSFFVYKIEISSPVGSLSSSAPGLRMLVNNDDDNQNNVADLNEVVVMEDDMIQFDINIEPASLIGDFTISASNGGNLKAWDAVNKTTEIALPSTTSMPIGIPPSTIFVEGRDAGESTITLSFLTDEGITLNNKDAVITFIDLKLKEDTNHDHAITSADNQILFTEIATWEKGYDAAFSVRNNADPDNFVDRDSARFYISVNNPSANRDPAIVEKIQVGLSVINADASIRDDMTNQELIETGVNTGIFVSKSQILTSYDIQVDNDPNADDEFAAHDGISGGVVDDALNDRTHQVNIDASVQLSYAPSGVSSPLTQNVPVFQRNPDYRRRVDIEVHVFNEPFLDVGLDQIPNTGDAGEGDGSFSFTDTNTDGSHNVGEPSEPYIDFSHGGASLASGSAPGIRDGRGPIASNAVVQDQMDRADIAWAQAGIKINLVSTSFENAPLSGGMDILIDGNTSMGAGNDEQVIYDNYKTGMSNDVLKIFFVGMIPRAYAAATMPIFTGFPHGEHSFVIIRPKLDINLRTVAHELGHVLTNTYDSLNPQTEFYPATNTGTDDTINNYRRLKKAIISQARKSRPSGNTSANGSTLLKK